MGTSRFGGQYNAVNYAYGISPGCPPLVIQQGPGVSGVGTAIVQFGYTTAFDGTLFYPMATNAPILVGAASSAETVTPTGVSGAGNPGIATNSATANFAQAHFAGELIKSGTCGLQEAINFAASRGGGTVLIDGGWTQLGGTAAMLAAANTSVATTPAGGSVQIQDNRGGGGVPSSISLTIPTAQALTLFSVGYPLIPAPGAGNLIVVERLVLENKAAGAAFAGGGVLSAAYGPVGAQVAATGTIAATLMTAGGGTTAQVGQALAVAPANAAATTTVNVGVSLYAATADFTAGGTSTVLVKVFYRIVGGF